MCPDQSRTGTLFRHSAKVRYLCSCSGKEGGREERGEERGKEGGEERGGEGWEENIRDSAGKGGVGVDIVTSSSALGNNKHVVKLLAATGFLYDKQHHLMGPRGLGPRLACGESARGLGSRSSCSPVGTPGSPL